MDKVNQVAMLANTEALKEPRGFIKFLQVILAIFAFATTTAYRGSTGFIYKCFNDTKEHNVETDFSYAFRLDRWSEDVGCNGTSITLSMYGNMSSAAEFYVFVGVVCFLYSLGAILLYVFADDKYHQNTLLPAADFVITVIFALLWLISSSAWADGLTKVKHYTHPDSILVNPNTEPGTIEATVGGSYASLNVSIIFGFLNMVVWGGNLWFLYKETKWFGGNASQQQQHQAQASAPEAPHQRI